MTLKRFSILLVSIAIFALLCSSWINIRPDGILSSLDKRFPIQQETSVIVYELENLGFDYTFYEYRDNGFQFLAGTPSVSPLPTFPDAPVELLDNCDRTGCSALRSNKLEYVYVFGFLRFHHVYRYIWIFHEGRLVGVSQNNGYWGFIL